MFKQGKLDYIRIAIVITGVFIYSCEKEVSSDKLVERNGLTYELNSETPFSGKSVEFFEGGEVKRESKSYKDGKLDGVLKTWFENGQLSSEDLYKNGLANGVFKIWRENGQQLAETSWKKDKANGQVKFWYENGQMKSDESYIDDERQGLKRVWYENGQQQFQGTFKDGHLNGKIQEWHKNGRLARECTFENRELNGIYKRWHENGALKSEGKYLNDQKIDPWTYWDQNGEEKIMMSDIDGNLYATVKIGDQVWMAENLRVTHYRNGDPIPSLRSKGEDIGAYSFYNNKSSYGDTYGVLYNWFAIHDSRKLAPEGWHVPTDDEWKAVEMTLGMSQSEADGTGYRGTNEGSKLSGIADLWDIGNMVNNSEFSSSGFTALPGGFSSGWGSYSNMGSFSQFWSATESPSARVWSRSLYYDRSDVNRDEGHKNFQQSVRCLKDQN